MPRFIALALLQVLFLCACGGGSGGDLVPAAAQTIANPAPNVQTVTIDSGPAGVNALNIPYVSVTICQPGNTANCQTIDHIELDTGSFGLRIISSVLSPSLNLTQELDANKNPIVECTQFADGYSWGPVKLADVNISGESAANVPIQVIGDASFGTVPADCSKTGVQENSVAQFGANGILGVGVFIQDCGSACVSQVVPATYYTCPSGGTCTGSAVSLSQQVSNPAALFAADNNGVIIELPAVSSSGEPSVTGAVVFGIGTQSNNGLGRATVLTLSSTTGYITTVYKGTSYANSYIDSGSNGNYFNDSTISTCPSATYFYCPGSSLSLSATNQSANGISSQVGFSVANADTLATNNNGANTAFNNLGGPNPDPTSFDFGVPFFLGRNVFTAFEGKNTSGGVGPYFAY